MRPRTRLAVSGFFSQIGSSALTTRSVSIAATGSLPSTGDDVGRERGRPLLPMLGVAPAAPVAP